MHKGSLVNVGIGMTLGAHITPLSRNFIEKADVVFVLASNTLVEQWVMQMHNDVRSLQVYYQTRRPRSVGYKEMVEAMLTEVRAGKNVCGVFYGHPGVFAWAPHASVQQAREEGYKAHMEPGISAEDCLYADVGIDPGELGCQHYDANQLLLYETPLNTSAYLVIWQIGTIASSGIEVSELTKNGVNKLQKILLAQYPEKHPVTIYESAVLPIEKPRIETVEIAQLHTQELSFKTTLLIAPAAAKVRRAD